jgi:hypothetical protein
MVQFTGLLPRKEAYLNNLNHNNMSVLSPTHKYWFVDKEDNGTNMHKYAVVTNETKYLGLLRWLTSNHLPLTAVDSS